MNARFSTFFRTRCCSRLALATLAMLVTTAAGRADTVWMNASGPTAKPFERPRVKIEGMSGDGLLFRSASADRAAEPKLLKDIWRIQVDDEPVLNGAETAFSGQKWDDAVTGYQRTLATSRKDWVKQFATLRLIAAAAKSGKFAASASAYATLVQRDPRTAAGLKPLVPKDSKAELPAAIAAVKSVAGEARLAAPQKATLQAFLAEMYIANGQMKEAEALSGKSPAPAPPAVGTNASPAPVADAANKGQLDLKLQLAVASLKQKKYQEAVDIIESIAPTLTDPEQQSDAMLSLAEAKAGLAGDDAVKLKEAALAYMRVVAHFKSVPDAPNVAEALLRAGVVLEQAKMLPDALAAYQAVQTDFKDNPHAKDAAAGASRVQKAMQAAKG